MDYGNTEEIVYFLYLPHEIRYEIFYKCDFRTIQSLRCTNKYFNEILNNIEFHNLFPEQIEHCKKLLKTLKNYGRAYDTSIMGSGKTYMSCSVSYMLSRNIFLISPRILMQYWKDVSKKFNIEVIKSITYNSLARNKYYSSSEKRITKCFEKILTKYKDQLFFIFDEASIIRNRTKQAENLIEIVNILYSYKIPILFLSSTPFDKEVSIIQVLRALGIFTKYPSYKCNFEICLNEIDDFFEGVLHEKLNIANNWCDYIGQKYPLFYKLYKKYILKNFIFRLEKFDTDKVLDLKIIKYRKLDEIIAKQINSHSLNTLYNNFNNMYQNFNNIKVAVEIVKKLEKLKVEIFIRIAEEKASKGYKVICIVNFTKNIQKIYNGLKNKFNVIFIHGKLSDEERENNIRNFNNNKNINILIATMKILSYGVSLHDKKGNEPRFMLISPNFSLLDILQASRRIYRKDVKSDCIVRIVFIDGINCEDYIYKKLWKKSIILKVSLGEFECNATNSENKLYICNIPVMTENEERNIEQNLINEEKLIIDKLFYSKIDV